MQIEYRNTYTVPFVEMVLDSYSEENNPFFRKLNLSVGSMMAIGFLEVNNDFKEIKDVGNIVNFIYGFEMFLQKFNSYQDIDTYFLKQTDKLQEVFVNSPVYINKSIPSEIQWTIETDEKNICVALIQVKKAFANCADKVKSRTREVKTYKSYDEGHIGHFATDKEQENIQSFLKKMYEISKRHLK